MKFSSVLLATAFFVTAHLATAIEVGSVAPPITVDTWVKGEKVDFAAMKGKKIVVVEFWATWCPPCRESIPHLTKIQKKYQDVAIVGITDEEVDVVKKFVTKMGDKMDYSIGIDSEQKTLPVYMKEFLPRAPIPWSFIVDKQGIVVWGGSAVPGGGMEEALADVVAGKLSGEKAKKRDAAQKKLKEFVELAGASGNDAKLDALAKELEALDAELGGIQTGKKFDATEIRNRVKFEKLQSDYMMAVMANNSSSNLARLEQKLGEVAPKDFDLADFKEIAVLNKDFNEYMRASTGRGDTNRLPALAKNLAENRTKSHSPLLQVAWNILNGDAVQARDVELATTLAKRAVDLTEQKNMDALFVYGKSLSEGGKVSDAIVWHKKAIALAADNDAARQRLESELANYEAKLKN
jgi:thiol-disulfide isomerase/thioredoxin